MLRPFGWLYGQVMNARNALYDRGVLRSYPLEVRTISIGNITAGGTGKTPLVAYVAKLLAENGEKVCILTRGYGRESRGRVLVSDSEHVLVDARSGGDEPVELARKLLGKAVVVADADRIAAAEWAKRELGITAFVLDDAFQHRRAKRDLDIICVDATDPFGNGSVLPAGSLREPLKNLARADAIVITRANLVKNISNLKLQISNYAHDARIFESKNEISGLKEINLINVNDPGDKTPGLKILHQRSEFRDQKALAFCGIGNPDNFFRQLKADGFKISAKKPFPDHHYYTQDEIGKLENLARASNGEVLVTTAKDAVKLAGFNFSMPCYAAISEISFSDVDEFHRLVTSF